MRKLKRNTYPVREKGLHIKPCPSEERIRQRAYEIHKARGGGPGQELDDWLQAERELLAEQEHPPLPGGVSPVIAFAQDRVGP